VKASGDFPATVTPNSFDMAGGTQALRVDVSIPKSAKAGTYAITAIADDGAGATSQAVITLTATAPPKVVFKQKRIRLYGIHFDYDSAHIQPRSEPVIKEIADVMKQNPSLRFEVEGHTDSDGGAAYNLALSQKRAESVVNDLVHRYHIAHSRLVPKGYGLTKPVASNATEGGKALNRRVELVRQ
jgi:outer membrane protein OmpA-like peptidoglycan-associated protein